MQVLIILAVFWLAASLVEKLGLDDPLKKIIIQLLVIVGLVLAVLACFGVVVLDCLAR